jgi:hypothetical protein
MEGGSMLYPGMRGKYLGKAYSKRLQQKISCSLREDCFFVIFFYNAVKKFFYRLKRK